MTNRTMNNLNMTQNKNLKPEQQQSEDGALNQDNKDKYPKELGGRKKGLEPTRYGDWEKNGRCIDF